jgi:hypothetical protein
VTIRAVVLTAGIMLSRVAAAEEPDALSQQSGLQYEDGSENPVAHNYTLPLRYRAAFDDGFYNGTTSQIEINNALVPIPLGSDWFLITRSKGAFVSQAPKAQGNSWEDGLNDAQTTLFLSPAHGNGFYWGVGPAISLPTATNPATGSNRWGTGPSVAFTWRRPENWSFALVANNVWSLGGYPDGTQRASNFLLNPIFSYRVGDGWSLSTSPNITANWIAKPNSRWTVPVGGGVSKAFKFGSQPMSIKFETYYNPIRASGASTWVAQLTLTFLFAR